MKFFPLLINGKDVDTGKYRFLPYADAAIINPTLSLQAQRKAQKDESAPGLDELLFAKYAICDESHVESAIRAACTAEKIFSGFSFSRRVKIMNDIHELLIEKRRELLDLMIVEGHPEKLAEWEYLGMEMAYRNESIQHFKSELRGSYGERNGEATGWIRKPDGVVCVSPPGNASCSNSLTAGFALLGGNTVIVKPPIRSPIATLFLWRDIVWEGLKRNGAPPGTVNTLVGNHKIIMDKWLDSPDVNDIFFFGESATGLEVGAKAFQKGKKPLLELSGNDMLVVWKDADLDLAAQSLKDVFLGSTQICMLPKKALIHEDIYDEFERLFLDKISDLKIGLPSDPGVSLTPVGRIDDCFSFLSDARELGGWLLCGGQRVNHLDVEDPKGMFVRPTVIKVEGAAAASKMLCVREENFFPLVPLIKISGGSAVGVNGSGKDGVIFDQMVKLVNNNRYGLRTSVWIGSNYYLAKFIKMLNRSGLIRINSRHIGFSSFLTTHGGSGLSGGPFGEANYVWQKTTHLQCVSVVRMHKENPSRT